MAGKEHRLDDAQFSQILKLLCSKPERRVSLAVMLGIAQLLAILGAGAWALVLYFSDQQSIERELMRHKLVDARDARLGNPTFTLEIKRDKQFGNGTVLFHVVLRTEFENISNTRFELSYAITQCFIAEMPIGDLIARQILEVNPPPNIFNKEQDGPLIWKPIGVSACILKSDLKWDQKAVLGRVGNPLIDYGGGLACALSPGEHCLRDHDYYVVAHPESFVGIVVNVGIDGATEKKGTRFYRDWKYLDDVDAHSTADASDTRRK